IFFFSSRRRHTRSKRDWSSDVCSSDLFDGSSIEGFVRIEESDMYLYPDLDTWMIFPWESEHGKVARLICDIYNPDGTPFSGDPRSEERRVGKEWRCGVGRQTE